MLQEVLLAGDITEMCAGNFVDILGYAGNYDGTEVMFPQMCRTEPRPVAREVRTISVNPTLTGGSNARQHR
jgi:hypothetical protein